MKSVLINIAGINIYWYSFLIFLAVVIGSSIIIRYSKKFNISKVMMTDLIVYTIIDAIIGARLYYVAFNFDSYRNNLVDILKIWEGGLAIYGGIIAGVLCILNYCHKKGLPFVRILDICSLSLLLGQAIGRWGNFFNSEAYGPVCSKAFLENLHIPEFIINGMNINGAYHQPTFLYESLWCLIGVIILFVIRQLLSSKTGLQVSFYMLWYGVGRYFIEALRMDSLYYNGYRVSQIVSIVFILFGIVSLIISIIHKPVEDISATGYEDRI